MSLFHRLKLSLRAKLLLTFGVVFVIALVVFAVLALSSVYSDVVELAKQQEKANIAYTAELVPILIYAEDLTALVELGKEGDDLFTVVLEYLKLARGADESVQIDTIVRSPQTSEPVYVVSTQYDTNPDTAPRLRQPFEDPDKYEAVFTELNEIFVINEASENYIDFDANPIIEDIYERDGKLWASAYVPMVSSGGEVVGVGWIHVNGLDIADVPQRIVVASLGAAALVFPVLIIVVVLFSLFITRPLRDLVKAAQEIEQDQAFHPDELKAVSERSDELGQLSRVFCQMAVQVQQRQQRLQQQVATLRIEIDRAKQEKQVKEITETDFFRDLQRRAQALRARKTAGQEGEDGAEDDANVSET